MVKKIQAFLGGFRPSSSSSSDLGSCDGLWELLLMSVSFISWLNHMRKC
jgi:hypothetical protein